MDKKKISNSKLIGLATNKKITDNKKNKTAPVKNNTDEIKSLINNLPETEEEKELNAKAIADKLIKDIPELSDFVESTNESKPLTDDSDKLINRDDDKSVSWMQEQIDLLSVENERLNIEIENLRLMNNNPDVMSAERENIILLFREFQANFHGLNQERRKWDIVNLEYLIKTFLEMFPYLYDYKIK